MEKEVYPFQIPFIRTDKNGIGRKNAVGLEQKECYTQWGRLTTSSKLFPSQRSLNRLIGMIYGRIATITTQILSKSACPVA